MTDDFQYTEGIDQITPFTLNMTLFEDKGKIVCQFRKTLILNDQNKGFLKGLFMASLKGIPVTVNTKIIFRDEVAAAVKLKKHDLLNINLSINDRQVSFSKKSEKLE